MSIKILHLADIHFCRETKDQALVSFNCAIEKAREENIDLWALAGDLFEKGIQNSDKDGFGELISVVREMLNIAPVVTVYGTSSHDVSGCYDVFKNIKSAENQFVILQPGTPYLLTENDGIVVTETNGKRCDEFDKALLFGLPEPSKAWLIAGTEKLDREAINEQIRTKLREILLGYGAIRKKHPDIPCLFLYHGLINGVEACSGQTLTGDIAISRDDLAMVGADYYALGHIHKAQQIPGLPAFYVGSAFPVNWGELDQKKFNIAILKENRICKDDPIDGKFKKIPDLEKFYQFPFPHSPRKKIELNYLPVFDDSTPKEIEGFQVWVDFKLRGEDKKKFDEKQYLNEMLKDGACPGSRITVSEIPVETVRAVEIQGVKSLPEKVIVYGKNSDLQIRQSILEKASQIEAEARKIGLLPQPHAWRLLRVKTRGLKGIRRGMGVDEYEIDFSQFNPGLIAFVAENGTGKTTMMLNCHAYPSMLTHDKKLQDYFCLRDSFREVYILDEAAGIEYRARMMIDGKNPSGKAEYYLERKSFLNNTSTWEPITSGKVRDYEEKIIELFGSEGLYLRSAFIPSKPSPRYPDLSFVPQGEKKKILYELAGISHYAIYHESAKLQVGILKSNILTSETTISANAGLEEKINDLTESVFELERQIGLDSNALEAIEEAGKEIKTELDSLVEIISRNTGIKAKIESATDEQKSVESQLSSVKEILDELASEKRNNPQTVGSIDKLIAKHAELTSEKNRLKAEENTIDRKNIEIEKLIRQRENLEADIVKMDREIDDINKKFKNKMTCIYCGKEQCIDQKKLENEMLEASETKRQKVDALEAFDKKNPIPEVVFFDPSPIYKIKEELAGINLDKLKTLKTKIDENARLEIETESKVLSCRRRLRELTESIKSLQNQIDRDAEKKHAETSRYYEQKRREYQEKKAEISGKQGRISVIKTQIEDKQKTLAEVEKIKVEVSKQKAELADWEFLAEACGIDGIPALELDAVAPEISATANDLLGGVYGTRFNIEFRTTKISGAGSKKKQVEDFAIWITDSEDGWTQPYETLSGGEETWVKKAIADAFEIIKAKNTGVKMLTVFQDELDGKLDPRNREIFFKLLQQTHEKTGRHHTIVVTHSEAIQDMIPQKIEMRKVK